MLGVALLGIIPASAADPALATPAPPQVVVATLAQGSLPTTPRRTTTSTTVRRSTTTTESLRSALARQRAGESRESGVVDVLVTIGFLIAIAAYAIWWFNLSPEEQEELRERRAARRRSRPASSGCLSLGLGGTTRSRSARGRRRQYRKLTPWYARGAHNYSGRTNGKTILYRFYDSQGKLLYVGITNNFDRRLQQHLADKWWAPQIARTQKELYPSRTAAQNAEQRAIRSERPRHNVAHNQGFLGLPRRRQ